MTSGDIPDDAELIAKMQSAKLMAERFSDHQAAIAGRETGRILPRIGQNAPEVQSKSDKKHNDTVELLTNLQAMLQDPEYAALYNEAGEKLRETEIAVEAALEQAQLALSRAEEGLQEVLDNASRLPDGTNVFKDANGNVWTEKGRRVGDEEAASIIWLEGAASYEEYVAQRDSVDAAKTRVGELEGYQVELGEARNRYEDEDKPLSEGELKDMKERNEEILSNVSGPKVERDIGKSFQSSTEIEVPDLNKI